MVAAGLAGATPHMISATITAISRLVFEFKGQFTSGTTLHTFPSSRNEISFFR